MTETVATEPEFMTVAENRFWILTITSFGLYELYWFYKNWKAVKLASRPDIWPVARAFFAVFFVHDLFNLVADLGKKHGYTNLAKPGTLATIYIVYLVVSNLWNKAPPLGALDFPIMVISVLAPVFIIWPVQAAINEINASKGTSQKLIRPYTGGELTVIVIGSILLIFSTLGFLLPDSWLNAPTDAPATEITTPVA